MNDIHISNRLLVKLEDSDDPEAPQLARVQAFKDHLRVDLYRRQWLGAQYRPLSNEVLSFKDHPELEGIYSEGAWSAIGLAALVDIFATDDCEDQTEASNRPFENWQATGNPDPSKAADF